MPRPASSTSVRSPRSVSSFAAQPPLIPLPTTIASYVVDWGIARTHLTRRRRPGCWRAGASERNAAVEAAGDDRGRVDRRGDRLCGEEAEDDRFLELGIRGFGRARLSRLAVPRGEGTGAARRRAAPASPPPPPPRPRLPGPPPPGGEYTAGPALMALRDRLPAPRAAPPVERVEAAQQVV